jgi:uncharacterized protein
MGFDRFIQALMPTDKKFYSFFEESADLIVKGAEELKKLGTASQNERQGVFERIENLEHECDNVTHKVYDELNKTFVTPFDREDIHMLASELDDIMDFMDESSKRCLLYKLKEIPDPMVKLIEILYESAIQIKQGVTLLRHTNKTDELRQSLRKVHEYENQADTVFEQTLANLFDVEKDAILVIKLKDIYGSLERATDKCEAVANVLETILIKHA